MFNGEKRFGLCTPIKNPVTGNPIRNRDLKKIKAENDNVIDL